MKLIKADVVRDGGSLAAFFRRNDGSLLSLFLQVHHRDDQQEPWRFSELRMSDGIQPEDGWPIPKNSAVEAALFSEIDAWLQAPEFSDEWGVTAGREQGWLAWLRELREHAALRDG